jgi:hypothetical protein
MLQTELQFKDGRLNSRPPQHRDSQNCFALSRKAQLRHQIPVIYLIIITKLNSPGKLHSFLGNSRLNTSFLVLGLLQTIHLLQRNGILDYLKK